MSQLLNIAPPTHELPRSTLDAPGGFLWWYADILDAAGNGVVLIWSFGLPFLPGYAAAARSGSAESPRDRPSLNISIYREGKLVCYLLQEFEPHEASWHGDQWRFGDSTLETTTQGGERTLTARLDCPIPASGERLQGTVTVVGSQRKPNLTDGYGGVHDWAPLTAVAAGRISLRAGASTYRMIGRGYFDCNVGSQPLHDAGIWAWAWGRIPLPGEDRLYYVLWPSRDGAPEAHGIAIDQDGALQQHALEVTVGDTRRGMAGLRHPSRLELSTNGEAWLISDVAEIVDDGPFYNRHFVRSGGGVRGFGEYCRPDLVDLSVHRPLVRMRIHRSRGENSMWLPLFSGPREGRLSRLFRQFGPLS